jgi:D-alanine-D-alanine ligase
MNSEWKESKKLNISSCLGPINNLEEHVDKEWWNRIFNSFYLKTDGDIVEDNLITSKEIDLFSGILALKPTDRILDLCCGQGRHSLELARRGFTNIEGLDRSHFLIKKAKERARDMGLTVKFQEGDARKIRYPTDAFDVVLLLGNSFGYFKTIKDDFLVLKEIFRVLKPWSRILIDLADGEYLKKNFSPHSWEWIDKNLFVCRERSLSLDKNRLISRELVCHVNKGVLVDQFYAERLYSQKKISELLQKAGFSNIIFHGDLTPLSQRNQDLGMMEKRILVSAWTKKEWTVIEKKQKKLQKNVVVIFGDPNKPDILKPLRIFDDDDFYTIEQLKKSLQKLKGYNFIYLTNHNNLIQELLQMRGKVDYVFNLCDEGYDNNARNELHIPALLDILKIPYTGAGPQCLAFCYDKSLVRGIAKEMGIPVPHAIYIKPKDEKFDFPLYFPAIVKPNFGDSSFGITQQNVIYNGEDLINVISILREQFGYNSPILIEQFLPGKDLTLGIIGNSSEDFLVLPISEEDYSELLSDLPKICGYEAKWLPNSPYSKIKSVKAKLPLETEELIQTSSLKLFERLECRDYVRFDWRLDIDGNPKLLEVNPNPGWCWDGHLAKMAGFNNINYEEMILNILTTAEKRIGLNK